MRTPFDVVIDPPLFRLYISEDPTPFATEDPWLVFSILVACTGATLVGQDGLTEEEKNELAAYLEQLHLYPRAMGRKVEVCVEKEITFQVDGISVFRLSLNELHNKEWWIKPLLAVMGSEGLGYACAVYQFDSDGRKVRFSYA